MLEAAQIEVLILEGVRQLVRHDRFLAVQINPVGQVKLPRLRIVIAGNLFGQHSQHQGPVLKISRREPSFFRVASSAWMPAGVVSSSRLLMSARSISARDWAELWTGRRIERWRIALVSLRTFSVA